MSTGLIRGMLMIGIVVGLAVAARVDPHRHRGAARYAVLTAIGMGAHPRPVCGTEIDPERAPAHATVDGIDYWSCAQGCRDEFLAARRSAREPSRHARPNDNNVR